MANVPAMVEKRLKSAVPRFKDILQKKVEEDVNEADTVTIITDILVEVFGFDRYSDITKEYGIRGNYKCDLAVVFKEKVAYLIEVKSIGTNLSEKHLKQAVNYAAREGIDDVVLTNGLQWQLHRVTTQGKVQTERLCELDFLNLDPKRTEDLEQLFLLCKRGVQKNAISEFYEHSQIFSPYTVGALLLTDPILRVVRAELRKLKSGMKPVSPEQIKDMLEKQIIKRDLLGEDGDEARKLIARATRKQRKAAMEKNKNDLSETQEAVNRESVEESSSNGDATKSIWRRFRR
ncbi:MAG: type I restriction enzyme HsdR N-terminal domain-containing protein [Hyphomicrobiales bacterium]|nr:type I restriction enzyme HsdR N-terminal domain-containing protein [Hyphomicrobiales bacterium]MCY4052457.1 type I restriction enzyme HsdR N-terminal domain-containing protein [Hyphomicrobiales bacterium]